MSSREPDGVGEVPAARSTTSRWQVRPSGSTWGDFGADDVLGRLNLVGPDQVRKGIAEVVDGRTFCLSLPLDQPAGVSLSAHRLPPIVRPTRRAGHVNFNCDMSVAYPGASEVVSDDLVVLHTQFSTQWDAFGHVGARFDADRDGVEEVLFYNGWRAGHDVSGPDSVDDAGLDSLGTVDGAAEGSASTSNAGPVDISHMAVHGVQGRAVLVDLEAHLGREHRIIGGADLLRAMDGLGATVEPGDFLVLHTGFGRALIDGTIASRGPGVGAVLDGTDPDLLRWVTESGVAAIAADNHAVEAFPAPGHGAGMPVLPLHHHCLFKLGVHLGELWWLADLADHLTSAGRTRFLLTSPPLRLPRATGSPTTPIATT